MIVYEVFDNDSHSDHGRYFRNLREARAAWAGVRVGELTKIHIRITDRVIALLLREDCVIKAETLERKDEMIL